MASIQRSSRSGRRRAMSDINVVPYIDVMLVLLVIFMVTAPFVNPGVVNLPSVGGAQVQPLPPIFLNINEKEQIKVNENGSATRTLTRSQLVPLLESSRIKTLINLWSLRLISRFVMK